MRLTAQARRPFRRTAGLCQPGVLPVIDPNLRGKKADNDTLERACPERGAVSPLNNSTPTAFAATGDLGLAPWALFPCQCTLRPLAQPPPARVPRERVASAQPAGLTIPG